MRKFQGWGVAVFMKNNINYELLELNCSVDLDLKMGVGMVLSGTIHIGLYRSPNGANPPFKHTTCTLFNVSFFLPDMQHQ